MAAHSLSKNPHKLNLTRRQAALFQKIILTGNQMAEMLEAESKKRPPKAAVKLARRWSELMMQLVSLILI